MENEVLQMIEEIEAEAIEYYYELLAIIPDK